MTEQSRIESLESVVTSLVNRIESLERVVASSMLNQPEEDETAEALENPLPLVEQVAENMAIYANVLDDSPFMRQAAQLLRSFEAIEGRPAADCLEIEQWSMGHLDGRGRFLVLPGGGDGPG
jgi:hypothetical protein